MQGLLKLVGAFDKRTAGVKTYAGLVLAGAAVILRLAGALDEAQAAALELAGLAVAGVGRAAAEAREEPKP